MQVGDYTADWEHISHRIAEVKADCCDVMQEHFLEVIHTLVEECVRDKVLQVVSKRVEGV